MTDRLSVGTSVRHILHQVRRDRTLAAADHLLVRKRKEDLTKVIHSLVTQLPDFLKQNPNLETNVFTGLMRIGLNLVGQDVKAARIPARVVVKSLSILRENTIGLEDSWTGSANEAVKKYLAGMSSVNSGDSLPGYMAERIEKRLAADLRPSRFIDAFGAVARDMVYWRMVEGNFCKFGNDYVRGLETLRHLGFCQVSTNPVLAAKAFDEDPALLERLRDEIRANPSWLQNPRDHGHEMVMAGTLLVLWPNLEVFRPLAYLANNRDYMISFQLNPNVADDAEESLDDARRAYKLASLHVARYDRYLGVPNPGRLRPNLVFKVAGSSEAARHVTRKLNAMGIGTNNTVTFTVGQEVQLIMDALEGKIKAIKSGKPVSRTYETNMGGRFVSHLRELEAVRILVDIAERIGDDAASRLVMRLARSLGLAEQEIERARKAPSAAQKAEIVCAFRHLKSLAHDAFLEIAAEEGCSRAEVEQLEADLKRAGTLVAKKVYSVFYEKKKHGRWVAWLQKEHKIGRADAVMVLDSMDVLPASKRVPEDTYDTLGSQNMCNTEFPNHARAVQLFSERESFDLSSYRNAVLLQPDPQLVNRLTTIEDFVRGYEFTKNIALQLMHVGVLSDAETPQVRGIREQEWKGFGAVKKTMAEFREAYEKFLAMCVNLASNPSNKT